MPVLNCLPMSVFCSYKKLVSNISFAFFMLLIIASLAGCHRAPKTKQISGSITVTDTPMSISSKTLQPSIKATQTTIPRDVALKQVTVSPESTPSPPSPTPTPVPLPSVCLRPEFTADQIQCGDVPQYEITLTVATTMTQLTGQQDIHYTNIETVPLTDLYLRLFPNTPGYGGYMSVTHVVLNEHPVTAALTATASALHVPLEPALGIGQAITLHTNYVVDVPTHGRKGHGLFSYQYGVLALPTAYPLIPVYDSQGWRLDIAPEYGDDVFADIALYNVHITAPAGHTLIASGSCEWASAGGNIWTWTCEAVPMRDFVFIMGDDYRRASRKASEVVVNSYFYSEHKQSGNEVLKFAADALETFSLLFGPYPYTELDVVETPNRLGGMEYPGLVVLEDSLYPGMERLEWLTAHEVAHQWWFGVVGSDPIATPWLDEALTQYSIILYYENIYGPEHATKVREIEFNQTHRRLKRYGHDMPAGLPTSAYGASLYWDVVYDKGALYFHALREAVGDKVFFEILQTYYVRHRYQIATASDFLKVVQDVAGDPHQELFETWIAGTGNED